MAVTLVTGASSGIGLATAAAFAERGDRVFGSVRGDAGEAQLFAASTPAPGTAADPAVAAAVIVAAATGERPGFRHPAGADAEAILAARAGATDDEWLVIVRAHLRARG